MFLLFHYRSLSREITPVGWEGIFFSSLLKILSKQLLMQLKWLESEALSMPCDHFEYYNACSLFVGEMEHESGQPKIWSLTRKA